MMVVLVKFLASFTRMMYLLQRYELFFNYTTFSRLFLHLFPLHHNQSLIVFADLLARQVVSEIKSRCGIHNGTNLTQFAFLMQETIQDCRFFTIFALRKLNQS